WPLHSRSSAQIPRARPRPIPAYPPARTVCDPSAACRRHTQPSRLSPFFRALGTLAVETAGARLGLPPLLGAHLLPQGGVNSLERAIAGPCSEVVVDRALGGKVTR